MKFLSSLALSCFIGPISTLAVLLGYNDVYDDPNGSLTTVACSDGTNGLITRGYTTFSSLPSFPYIASVFAVAGWNSTNCGTCWQLWYTDADKETTSINVLAIDYMGTVGPPGLDDSTTGPETSFKDNEGDNVIEVNVSLEAMNVLTSGHGVEFGVVDVGYQRVDPSLCGM